MVDVTSKDDHIDSGQFKNNLPAVPSGCQLVISYHIHSKEKTDCSTHNEGKIGVEGSRRYDSNPIIDEFCLRLIPFLTEIPGMDQPENRGSLLDLYFNPLEKSTIELARKSDDMYTDFLKIVKGAANVGRLDGVISNAVGRPQKPENKEALNEIKQEYLEYLKQKKERKSNGFLSKAQQYLPSEATV